MTPFALILGVFAGGKFLKKVNLKNPALVDLRLSGIPQTHFLCVPLVRGLSKMIQPNT